MLKDRLTPIVFATVATMLLGAALQLGAPAPLASAAPRPVLTASAQPPTHTPTPPPNTSTPTTPPTATPIVTPPPTPTGTSTTPIPTETPTGGPTETPTAAPTEPPPSERRSDPAVAKEATSDEVALGGEISYSIVVTNEGDDIATGVIVEDTLPSYLQLLSASVDKGQAVINGNTAGFWIGNVAPGEVVRGSITARVVALPPDGVIVNEAVLRSTGSDRPQNNRASAQVRVRQPADAPTATAPVGELTPTPTPPPMPGTPAPTPTEPAPTSLPVTAGTTGLPLGVLALVALAATGYIAAGLHFWRRPRK